MGTAVIAVSLTPLTAQTPLAEYPDFAQNALILEGNAYISQLIPFWAESRSYLILDVKNNTPEEHSDLLGCLIKQESGGDELAYNPKDTDNRPAYGLLQFKDFTFKEWCVDIYGYKNDIWDGEIQYQCAYKMIFEDNEGWRWPPLKRCF